MTDQQIDEFLEMLAKSPTSARDMVRWLFAAHEAKAVPAVLFDEREAFEKWVTENGEWPQALRRESGATSYYLASTAAKWEAWQARAAIEKSAAKGPAVPQGEPDVWVREQRGTYEGIETLDPMFVFGSTNPGPGRHGANYSPRYPAAPSQEPVTLTDEMVTAGGRALCDIAADSCNVDREDNWNMYGDMYKSDATACLIAALREKGGV